jgi:hypothetical protein
VLAVLDDVLASWSEWKKLAALQVQMMVVDRAHSVAVATGILF